MPITKALCPTCKKPAVTVKEVQVDSERRVMYECGHVDVVKVLSAQSYDNYISTDNKRPFKFQIEGAVFATETANGRFIIADEMGLGKTVQMCMILWSHPKELTPALIICKAGLKIQMSREISRWNGELWLSQIIESEKDFLLPSRVKIISMDTLWRFSDIESWMKRAKIKSVFIDECQLMKNSDAKRTNGIRKAAAQVKYLGALSGTPIDNNAAEYFPVLNLVHPDRREFSTRNNYLMTFVDSYFSGYGMKYGGLKSVEKFKNATSDFIIRRLRKDVLPDLPDILRDYRYVEMGEKVNKAYQAEVEAFTDFYNSSDDKRSVAFGSGVLAYMARMRHIVGIAKIEPCLAYLEDFCTETNRKICVFTHHKDVENKIVELLRDHPDIYGNIYQLPEAADLRYNEIERFKNDPAGRILIAATLASAEGLNLQFCSDCILLERQWVPTKEEQAEARFPRPGQTADKINAVYIVAIGTIDEYLAKIVEQKRSNVKQTLDGIESQWSETSIITELAEILANSGQKAWSM